MSNEANFNLQIDEMISKGRQRMGWILRTFKTREEEAMLVLYKTMVFNLVLRDLNHELQNRLYAF